MFRATLLILAASLAVALPARADEKMTVEVLLKKAIDAAGGADALKKYPAMRQTLKGSAEREGQQLTFTGEVVYTQPDKVKLSVEFEVQGQKVKVVQIMNGDAFAGTVAGMKQPLEDDDKKDLKETLTEAKIDKLYPLLDAAAYDVKLLPEKARVEGAEAYVVTVKPKGSKEIKLFFDAKTFLIAKTEKVGRDPKTKKDRIEESFRSEYEKVQGVFIGMKSKGLRDGKPDLETRITAVKLLEKIPDSEFDVSD